MLRLAVASVVVLVTCGVAADEREGVELGEHGRSAWRVGNTTRVLRDGRRFRNEQFSIEIGGIVARECCHTLKDMHRAGSWGRRLVVDLHVHPTACRQGQIAALED